MKAYDPTRVRTIALVGQSGAGKTTLAEALLVAAKAIERAGRVQDGTAHMDYEPEEVKRQASLVASLAVFGWQHYRLHLMDTPGLASFIAETHQCLRVADGVLVVGHAQGDLKVQTEHLWRAADAHHLPRLVVVSQMDRERADFATAVKNLSAALSADLIPVQWPLGTQGTFRGVVDLLTMTALVYAPDVSGAYAEQEIPPEVRDAAQQAAVRLVEKVAETDDALLEKYLEQGALASDDVAAGLRAATRAGRLFPVLCASGVRHIGAHPILHAIATLLPSPAERGTVTGTHPQSAVPETRPATPDAPFAALVFKTVADPFAGKLSIFRVYSGTVTPDSQVLNASQGQKERIGQLFEVDGKKQRPMEKALPGDLVAVAKLKVTITGDTLCDDRAPVRFPFVAPPPAVLACAIEPKSKGDEEKISGALARLREEDTALTVHRDEQTKEMILGGLGQEHLEVVVERMRRKFGVDVTLKTPRVPYKETIRRTASAQGKYKRQSGGRGQYGDAWVRLEPLARGTGFEFVDQIVGGVVPRQYIPAVEKGIAETLEQGVIAGFPVVDVRAILYDGSHHPVDSSELAFKIAGSMGFKKAMLAAQPALLEPIMVLGVTVPEEKMGDVIGDLHSRRGKVLGVEARGSQQVIRALVSMAEVLRYASDLRSMTSDRGEFTMEFSRYEEVPAPQAERVIAEHRTKEPAE